MASNINIEKIKKHIETCVGNNYDIIAKQGRKKILIENCTVDFAYPSIFTVTANDERTGKIKVLSFSYIDILTKNVSIFPAYSVKKEKGA